MKKLLFLAIAVCLALAVMISIPLAAIALSVAASGDTPTERDQELDAIRERAIVAHDTQRILEKTYGRLIIRCGRVGLRRSPQIRV